jgi:hypothetical protein
VTVKLTKAVPIDKPVTIRAEVIPVNGEGKTENNVLSFPAIFRRS